MTKNVLEAKIDNRPYCLRKRVKEELEEEGDCCITIKKIGLHLKINVTL
jgi:hypothetical protein